MGTIKWMKTGQTMPDEFGVLESEFELAGEDTPLPVTLADGIAGEDLTNGLLRTESKYSYLNQVTDGAVKGSAGVVHTVTFSPNDATPTAGTITILNATAAAAATAANTVFTWVVPATAFDPFTITLDAYCDTGIFVDCTTTGDINIAVTYR